MLKILMIIIVSLTIQMSNAENEIYERREDFYTEEPLWVDDKKDADVEEVKSVKYDVIANGKKEETEVVLEEEDVQEEVYVEEIQEVEYVEEVYIEEEVYVETEIYEDVVETVEEVYEEPVYTNGTSFEATAYAIGDGLTPNTYTRNGTDVSNTIYTPDGYRIIAVDMNVIPLNSIVRVTYSDGTTFLAMACDTGSAIVGNKIDILYGSVGEALNFGRQNVTVEILN